MSGRLQQANTLIETLNKRRVEAENEVRRIKTEKRSSPAPKTKKSPTPSPVKRATLIQQDDDENNQDE